MATLAGAGGAIQTILSYAALAACSVRLPEVTVALVGSGGEGKTLPISDLARDVWGGGFPDAPPSTPPNFR